MASQARLSDADIEHGERKLVSEPHRYSFLMLYRGLNRLAEGQGGVVRVRPALTLNLPRGEVEGVEKLQNKQGEFSAYQINVNLPGLYGSSSPLPNFYTEDLIRQDREEHTEARLFLDIFHQQYYRLLAASFQKYRAAFSLVEDDSDFRKLLWAFVGLRAEESREDIQAPDLFLRYQRLFSRMHRSAEGLHTLLNDFFQDISVEVEECVERKVRVSQGFQLALGSNQHALGESALVGNVLTDNTSQCRINIGPMSADQYHQLINGNRNWSIFIGLLSSYLKGAVVCELVFSIKKADVQTTVLGQSGWGQLGVDTWVYSQEENDANNDDSLLYARQVLG